MASLVGADPREIVWTSGATESDNLAIKGIAHFYHKRGKHIITLKTEHKAVLDTCRQLEREGFEVTYLEPLSNGLLDINVFKDAIREDTILASIMHVNNEIGTIQPIDEITELCHQVGTIIHSDAAQSMTTKAINVRRSNVELLSLSAHKIYGPKGIGALYVQKGTEDRLQPLLWGGGQEQGLRSGTLPTPLCVGFGAAAEIIQNEREQMISHIVELRNLFHEQLKNKRPEIELIGPNLEDRHVSNLSICKKRRKIKR